MNWEAMFPGKYIKSAEFAGKDITLTIKSVVLEELPDDNGGTKKRGVIYFNETPRALVINRTNATAIKSMFGPETNSWAGHKVTLWASPFTDPFTGEAITAVRVRGSPELDATKEFQAKIGRKQVKFKLVKTNGKVATKSKIPVSADDVQLPEPPEDHPVWPQDEAEQ